MGLLSNALDAFRFATMGQNEAMAHAISREVEEAKVEGPSMYDQLNDKHFEKNGTRFLEGKEKAGLRTAMINFTNAQEANAIAAGSFMNEDVMGMADAWGLDSEKINNAMAGYSAAANDAGMLLMNTLASMTNESHGALTAGNGGLLTDEEASMLMETIGTWNPEARNALEGAHERGKYFNSLLKKYGNDTFDLGSDKFGKKKEGDKWQAWDDYELNEIETVLNSIGMENLAASFKASAANDEMYRQNSIGKYQSDARNCATNAGGKLPDVETEVIGQPFERKITGGRGGEAGGFAGADEPWSAEEETLTFTKSPAWDKTALIGCYAGISSPMAREGYAWGDVVTMAQDGITAGDLNQYMRGSESYYSLFGQMGTANAMGNSYREWLQNQAQDRGFALTGLKVNNIKLPPQFRGLKFLDLTNKAHWGLIGMELAAAEKTNRDAQWMTGEGSKKSKIDWGDDVPQSWKAHIQNDGIFKDYDPQNKNKDGWNMDYQNPQNGRNHKFWSGQSKMEWADEILESFSGSYSGLYNSGLSLDDMTRIAKKHNSTLINRKGNNQLSDYLQMMIRLEHGGMK